MTFMEALAQAAEKPGQLFIRPVFKDMPSATRWLGTGYYFAANPKNADQLILWVRSPFGMEDSHAIVTNHMLHVAKWEGILLAAILKEREPIRHKVNGPGEYAEH